MAGSLYFAFSLVWASWWQCIYWYSSSVW